jgi:hypothetical protein
MNKRWVTRIAISVMATVGLGIIAPMAQAAPQLNAITVSSNVAGYRQDLGFMLNSYYSNYGNRLSPAEQEQMTGLITKIDKDLALLQTKTQLSAKLARAHAAAAKQRIAARAAAKFFDVTYAQAMLSLEQVQPILQPKLSLFEALRAKSDVDQSLHAFETLGTQLHALAA